MKEFDPEELGRFAGKDGAPVYICLDGKVYDVSGSELWETGTHMARHNAGRALDDEFGAAPHGLEVLERVPQVGILKKAPPRTEGSARPGLLDRHPFFKRHPHPMTVHFPIALLAAAFAFEALFAFTGCPSFRTTSLHCLALGFISVPFAMATGYLSWKVNYLGKPMRQVRNKITLSFIMTAVALFTLWRMWPAAARPQAGAFYLSSVLVIAVLVMLVGYFGGQLTFPVEKARGGAD